MMYGVKGRVKRTAQAQVSLAVRIIDQRHQDDVYERAVAQLGERAGQLGPLDLSRNSLLRHVHRLGTAYDVPPAVTGGLPPELVALLGDYSATTMISRYAGIDAHPLPTSIIQAARTALHYRIGAGYAGLLLGWSERAQRLYVDAVAPDDLELLYASDDPTEPTIIRHRRWRDIEQQRAETVDVYDLTDIDRPVFRVERVDAERRDDITGTVIGRDLSGEAWPWRYPDGRPYHRIVVTGHPRAAYATSQLIEATLTVSVLWTHWGAAVRDAGHPQRWVIGLDVNAQDSATGERGQAVGPEHVISFRHVDPDRPGQVGQWGPGFDPEVVGRAVRDYELQALQIGALPVSFEATGGEPTATEARALAEVVRQTYAECRRADGQVLARLAALAAVVEDRDGGKVLKAALSEHPYAVLYGDEITEALGVADADNEEDSTDDDTAPPGTTGSAGEPRGGAPDPARPPPPKPGGG